MSNVSLQVHTNFIRHFIMLLMSYNNKIKTFNYFSKQSSISIVFFLIKRDFTFSIPRMCILAIISAVNRNVTIKSQMKVTYWRDGTFSKVFGVFKQTEANETKAQSRINRLTHNWNHIKRFSGKIWLWEKENDIFGICNFLPWVDLYFRSPCWPILCQRSHWGTLLDRNRPGRVPPWGSASAPAS